MKKIIIFILILFVSFSVSSCETTNDDKGINDEYLIYPDESSVEYIDYGTINGSSKYIKEYNKDKIEIDKITKRKNIVISILAFSKSLERKSVRTVSRNVPTSWKLQFFLTVRNVLRTQISVVTPSALNALKEKV